MSISNRFCWKCVWCLKDFAMFQKVKTQYRISFLRIYWFYLFLTSRWGLVLWREDDKAKAFVVFALQSNIKALRTGRLSRLDDAWCFSTRHLGRAVDQSRCNLLGLLVVVIFSSTIFKKKTKTKKRYKNIKTQMLSIVANLDFISRTD